MLGRSKHCNKPLFDSRFPNPTSDLLNISLNDNGSNENYSETLYDLNGKTISVIENSISSQKRLDYKINLIEIIETKGIYYILIKSINGKQTTKNSLSIIINETSFAFFVKENFNTFYMKNLFLILALNFNLLFILVLPRI
jgi:hypothetical protein